MKTMFAAMLAFSLVPALCFGAEVVHAVHGVVDQVGDAGKTVAVKTSEGVMYTVHAGTATAVYGFDGVVAGSKGAFHGAAKGTEVVVHYTGEGAACTATTVRKVGGAGLKATEGTVHAIDYGAKAVAIKTADGTVHTFNMAEHATAVTSKATAKSVKVGAKAVVYSTETAGVKVAHFVRSI